MKIKVGLIGFGRMGRFWGTCKNLCLAKYL